MAVGWCRSSPEPRKSIIARATAKRRVTRCGPLVVIFSCFAFNRGEEVPSRVRCTEQHLQIYGTRTTVLRWGPQVVLSCSSSEYLTLQYTVEMDFDHMRTSSAALIELDRTIANLCSNQRSECRVGIITALDDLTGERKLLCLLDLYVAVLTLFTYPTVIVQAHLVIDEWYVPKTIDRAILADDENGSSPSGSQK